MEIYCDIGGGLFSHEQTERDFVLFRGYHAYWITTTSICVANEGPGKQEKLLQSGDVARDDGDGHLLTPFTGRHLGSSKIRVPLWYP